MRNGSAAIVALLIGTGSALAQPAAPPITRLVQVTILVHDQDAALAFYVDKLGFEKREDRTFGGFRWLTVAPAGNHDIAIVLEKPGDDMGEARRQQLAAQIGQAPSWVLDTADCNAAYETLKARGVEFLSPPKKMPYGVEAVFKDLYGNSFALIQHRRP
jgi:predicted enzyme related to lactoylglutathione lyase